MLKIQQKYIDFLELAKNSLLTVDQPSIEVDAALDKISSLELIVPMVGSFSAGKSTISNTLMGRQTLPVAVTPETDMAAELRYSLEERIEAVRKNDTFETFDIGDFGSLKDLSSQYEYLRVYVNNEFLKEIFPLVLVDMPGFDSTLKAHNKAIFRYIARGSHYIVLISSEEGTISRSVLENLEHIDITDQSFSIFLSKSDLRSQEDIELLTHQVKETAEDYLDYSGPVLPISYKQPDQLKQALLSIDPEKLFEHVAGQYIKRLSIDIVQPLTLKEASLKSDSEKEQEALGLLDDNLVKLEKSRAKSINSLRDIHRDKLVKKCKDQVEQALMKQLLTMANQLANGSQEAVKNQIANSVRNTIVRTLDTELRNISDDAIQTTVNSFNGLAASLSDLGDQSNWEETITDSIKDSFNNFNQALGKIETGLDAVQGKGDSWKKSYRIVTSIAAITTTIAAPIVELVIMFLPDILKFFGFGENHKKNKIIESLQFEVIPKILTEIDNELPATVDEQIGVISNIINDKFESKLEGARDALNSAAGDRAGSEAEINKKINSLVSAQASIRDAANRYVFQ